MRKFFIGVVVGWYLSDVIDEALAMAKAKLKESSDESATATGDAIGDNVTNVFTTDAPVSDSRLAHIPSERLDWINRAETLHPVTISFDELSTLLAIDQVKYGTMFNDKKLILEVPK